MPACDHDAIERHLMSASDAEQHPRELRSFGRKRGRKLSLRQQALLRNLLPGVSIDLSRPAPAALGQLFAEGALEAGQRTHAPEDVWLEIGFGGAEHMIWQASSNPNVGLIGCEPYEDGVVKALSAIESRRLANVRLHADDARPVLRWLPQASLGRVFILFPDPWPKTRHGASFQRSLSPFSHGL
jgi:tRNA (guanine-N7-)-methyltransferase